MLKKVAPSGFPHKASASTTWSSQWASVGLQLINVFLTLLKTGYSILDVVEQVASAPLAC